MPHQRGWKWEEAVFMILALLHSHLHTIVVYPRVDLKMALFEMERSLALVV